MKPNQVSKGPHIHRNVLASFHHHHHHHPPLYHCIPADVISRVLHQKLSLDWKQHCICLHKQRVCLSKMSRSNCTNCTLTCLLLIIITIQLGPVCARALISASHRKLFLACWCKCERKWSQTVTVHPRGVVNKLFSRVLFPPCQVVKKAPVSKLTSQFTWHLEVTPSPYLLSLKIWNQQGLPAFRLTMYAGRPTRKLHMTF